MYLKSQLFISKNGKFSLITSLKTYMTQLFLTFLQWLQLLCSYNLFIFYQTFMDVG